MCLLLTFHQYSALSLSLAYVPVRGGRSVERNTWSPLLLPAAHDDSMSSTSTAERSACRYSCLTRSKEPIARLRRRRNAASA